MDNLGHLRSRPARNFLLYSVPNIPGNFSHLRENGQPDPDGAFHSYGGVYGDEIVRKTPDQRPYAWETVGFLASRASNVYSDSVTTVQPAGIYVQMLIRYE